MVIDQKITTRMAGYKGETQYIIIPLYRKKQHEKQGRPISGNIRQRAADELKTNNPSTVFYERHGQVSKKQCIAGNTTNVEVNRYFRNFALKVPLQNVCTKML